MKSDPGPVERLLLDSTFEIDLLRGRKARQQQLGKLQADYEVFASVITYAEVCAGLRPGEEIAAATYLRELDHLPVTVAVAHRAGFLRRDLRARGITVELPDLLIAATALEYNLLLVTDNRRDFSHTGVNLFPSVEQ